MDLEQFVVDANNEKLAVTLAKPSKWSEASGLLINISATAYHALHDETQNHPTPVFLQAGHFVVSFDLPCHGERIDAFGEGIAGMGAAYSEGVDKFEQFVADGISTINACQSRGIGTTGRIVSYGVSRAGYCLLRLAAADARLHAVAGCSPVTDWGIVAEMVKTCPPEASGPLKITNWLDQMTETAVYASIGRQDDVVSTQACIDFATALIEKQRAHLPTEAPISELHIVDSPGHSPSTESRLDATRFLLDSVSA